jgi:hypothetical protein
MSMGTEDGNGRVRETGRGGLRSMSLSGNISPPLSILFAFVPVLRAHRVGRLLCLEHRDFHPAGARIGSFVGRVASCFPLGSSNSVADSVTGFSVEDKSKLLSRFIVAVTSP